MLLSCSHDIRDFLPFPMIGYTISLFLVTYSWEKANCQIRATRPFASMSWVNEHLMVVGHYENSSRTVCVEQHPTYHMPRMFHMSRNQHHKTKNSPWIESYIYTATCFHIYFATPLGYRHPVCDDKDWFRVSDHTPSAWWSTGVVSNSKFEVDSAPLLTATDIVHLDIVFGNFLDVAFSNSTNDYLSLDLNMLVFEFVPHDLSWQKLHESERFSNKYKADHIRYLC